MTRSLTRTNELSQTRGSEAYLEEPKGRVCKVRPRRLFGWRSSARRLSGRGNAVGAPRPSGRSGTRAEGKAAIRRLLAYGSFPRLLITRRKLATTRPSFLSPLFFLFRIRSPIGGFYRWSYKSTVTGRC